MVETFKNQELENVIFDLNSQDEWKEIVAKTDWSLPEISSAWKNLDFWFKK